MDWTNEETWVAVDGHGDERVFNEKPYSDFPNMDFEVLWGQRWRVKAMFDGDGCGVRLPKGTIKHLVGRELTYNDEPVRLKIK